MQFCSFCSTANRAGSRFCNQCGRPLRGPSLTCSRCQALITEADRFCHNCGARLTDASRQLWQAPTVVDAAGLPVGEMDPGVSAAGTFVEDVDVAESAHRLGATPQVPLRRAGSWQMIDSWISRQMQRGAPASPPAAGNGRPDDTATGGLGPTDQERVVPKVEAKAAPPESKSAPQSSQPQFAPRRRPASARPGRGRPISQRQAVGIAVLLLALGTILLWLLGWRSRDRQR